MKQKQLLKVSLVCLLVFCVLPCLQSVQAKQYGPWEFVDWIESHGQRIHPWVSMEISASKQSNVWHGCFGIPSNFLSEWRPFEAKLFIDDTEIDLKNKHFVFNDKDYYDPELPGPYHAFIYYIIFEADYFTPGEYDWRVELYIGHEPVLVFIETLIVTE
ncbi:MAG: hypothetical protein Q6364_14030 [Candidatus Hermodarchaeota archaeon]|nr:hypothetical protein [Candidatus Hermodarchaeota archaeon]